MKLKPSLIRTLNPNSYSAYKHTALTKSESCMQKLNRIQTRSSMSTDWCPIFSSASVLWNLALWQGQSLFLLGLCFCFHTTRTNSSFHLIMDTSKYWFESISRQLGIEVHKYTLQKRMDDLLTTSSLDERDGQDRIPSGRTSHIMTSADSSLNPHTSLIQYIFKIIKPWATQTALLSHLPNSSG